MDTEQPPKKKRVNNWHKTPQGALYHKEYNQKYREENWEKCAERSKKWAQAHPESNRAATKRWVDKNKDRVKATRKVYNDAHREENKEYSKRWKQENPEKYKAQLEKNRWRVRERKYGITKEQYEYMMEKQNHRCVICQEHMERVDRGLVIDHDHDTGRIRGLLCGNCNTALGLLNHDPNLIEAALNYLGVELIWGEMKVRLIAITRPVVDCDPQELIGYCARVSAPQNQDQPSERLLDYLVANKHWSPLEMVSVVMEITTSRAIARQILRHRSCHFQEFSTRYADPTDQEFILVEARLQDPKNRQNSIEVDDPALQAEWRRRQQLVIDMALEQYRWARGKNIAKECARAVLPEGNTPSRLYVAGTVRDWYHYCQLRKGNGTQKEHRAIAEAVWALMVVKLPFLEGHDGL